MIVIEHKNEELPHHRNLRITIGKIFYETAVLAQTIVMDFWSKMKPTQDGHHYHFQILQAAMTKRWTYNDFFTYSF